MLVKNFGGHEKTRSSSAPGPDGKRMMFPIHTGEEPAECADLLPNGYAVKGHASSEDGIYDLLEADCKHCGRAKGQHVKPGQEVRLWLSQMPKACEDFWHETGCTGDGFILIGGDNSQGYVMECAGCEKCRPSGADGRGAPD